MTDPAPAVCSVCGTHREHDNAGTKLAWVHESERGEAWLCPRCARAHVRDIEGKLPREYW